MEAGLILLVIIAFFALLLAAKTVRIIPQARAGVVERLGRYQRTLTPGLAIVVPFVDRVGGLIDLREQVVTFKPAGVITGDNVGIQIDSVLYFTITDAKSVSYEVANPLQAIEQLTVTTLRNVIGGMTLEEALTSRDTINSQLRTVLDEATGRWGIRVNRVEVKAIDPPASIQEAMEKQMRAERDRRAAILTAEGSKQSQILNAEGAKTSAVLTAEGQKTAAILRAEGEAKAIETVFQAIHDGDPDQGLLSYQYLQMLPKLAQGDANKIFVIPSEFSQALGNAAGALAGAVRPPAARAATAAAARVSSFIVPEAVEAYAAAHTTAPAPFLQAFAEETRAKLESPQMLTGEIEGRFLEFLVFLAQPRLVLEIGTYSGYSALSMAQALPEGGRIVSCELDPERVAFAERHIADAGMADRIEIRQGAALETIGGLDGPFDLVFIDADKEGYLDYYEAVLPKLSERGLIVVDNVLWSGRVAAPESDDDTESTRALRAFNDHVAGDARVVSVMLSVRDGVTLVRRA